MNDLDREQLLIVVNRYKAEKRAWGLLNKTVFKGRDDLKSRRRDLNRRMRKSESEIVKIAVHGCECGSCGNRKTMTELIDCSHYLRLVFGGSCCKNRKIVIRGSGK